MRSPIRAGDLVIIVRARGCGCVDSLGLPFVVRAVVRAQHPGRCHECGSDTFPAGEVCARSEKALTPLSRLKKIEPPRPAAEPRTTEDVACANC